MCVKKEQRQELPDVRGNVQCNAKDCKIPATDPKIGEKGEN